MSPSPAHAAFPLLLLSALAASASDPVPVECSLPSIFAPSAQWTLIGEGYSGCEGAQWIGDTLYYAAHHDHLALRWAPTHGLQTWRDDSPEATSFRPDGNGGFYVVEQTTRRLTRWNAAGQMTEVLADAFEGKRLNRPNDCVVANDGSVWFTDPDFLFKQRPEETKELDGQYVFRFVPSSRSLTAPIRHLQLPNGIAFSPDGKFLFVGDSATEHVFRFAIHEDGTASAGSVFATFPEKGIDGLTFDPHGRLWCCTKSGISILNAEGQILGRLTTPGKPTSIAFGPHHQLAVTMRDSIWLSQLSH